MKGYYEVKLNMDERSETVKRWWFELKRTDEKLIEVYTNYLLNDSPFNPLDEIRNFVSQYNCESAKSIKARIDSISGQAILNYQTIRHNNFPKIKEI